MSTYEELHDCKGELFVAKSIVCAYCVNSPCKVETELKKKGLTVIECLHQVTEESNWIQRMGTDQKPDDKKLIKWLSREVSANRSQCDFYHEVIRTQRRHIKKLEEHAENLALANALGVMRSD